MTAMVKVHAAAGGLALAMIATFMTASLVAEIGLGPDGIAAVKRGILWAIPLLVVALATAGASGFRLGRGWRSPTVAAKQRRMPFIAANGLVVLVPAAVFLAARAEAGAFDGAFYLVQAVEIVAGAINIALLGLNFRDGLKLARRGRA